MLGHRHPYADGPDVTERAGIPLWEMRPCNQCGLPRSNEVHALPPAPVLDVREAAAGEAVVREGPFRMRVASWSNPEDDALTVAYDTEQLAVDGRPVVTVTVTTDGEPDIVIPLDILEEMVASIRRRVNE
jgi:hypothetical protein